MNFKNDRKILKEISNCLGNRQFFSNRLGVHRFILSGKWEIFAGPDRRACAEAYIDSLIADLRKKDKPMNRNWEKELIRRREAYAEKFGKNWDALHKAGFVAKEELPRGAVAFVFGDKALADWLVGAGYDVVFRTEKPKAALPHEIARFVERAGNKVCSWSTNMEGFDLGLFKRELVEKDVPQLNLKVLPHDFVPSESDEPSLIELTPEQALAFRRLKTHNFVGTGQMGQMLGVCINGCLCGVLSYSTVWGEYYDKIDDDIMFIQCAVSVNVDDRRFRIAKFVAMVGLWDKACKHYLNDFQKEKYDIVGSTSISKYPENKVLRSIMKEVNREYDEKTGLYSTVYHSGMKKYGSIKEIYLEWLKKR